MEKIARDKRIKSILLTVTVRAVKTDKGPTGLAGPALAERVLGPTPEGEAVHPEASNDDRWGKWTPFFALVTAASWNDASQELDGVVLGGERDPEGILQPSRRGEVVERSPDGIYNWIVKHLLTDRFRKKWAPLPAPRTPTDVAWRYNGTYRS